MATKSMKAFQKRYKAKLTKEIKKTELRLYRLKQAKRKARYR